MKTAGLVFCLLLNLGQNVWADVVLKEISADRSCLSPNKEFLATLTDVIKIKDLRTGKSFDPVEVLSPIYCMAWGGDSKSLFTVDHIASGSQLYILQFRDNRWAQREIDPPPNGDFDSYKVVGFKMATDSARVSYITGNRGDNGGESLFQQITFDLALNDLSISHVKHKIITGVNTGFLTISIKVHLGNDPSHSFPAILTAKIEFL